MQSFSKGGGILLRNYEGDTNDILFKTVLQIELNRIVLGAFLYKPDRFGAVKLRPETVKLVKRLGKDGSGADLESTRGGLGILAQCNRMLLEDAYLGAFARQRGGGRFSF